jgi:alpha-methylacyl-CoA racemase
MMLADAGAAVIRVDRAGGSSAVDPTLDVLNRGRRSIVADLKDPGGRDIVLRLVEHSDILLEGFRPGVMERLGLGPDTCLERNPRLVYGRMTGWGQQGPLAASAGHDVNYIATAGVLANFARHGERPVPPSNVVGDFGGGGMLLAFGVLCAFVEATRSGIGQVVDAAMVDGAALFTGMICALRAQGMWNDEPGTNLLDTGAPFYDVYRTADDGFVAVGALEDKFYDELLDRCAVDTVGFPPRDDPECWPELRAALERLFATRTRAEWAALLEGTDACASAVLSLTEAADHPHLRHRRTYRRAGNVLQPAPAPRFSRTATDLGLPPPAPGAHTDEILAGLGFDSAAIARLRHEGVVS